MLTILLLKTAVFLKQTFFHCSFTSVVVISSHECDLLGTEFSTAKFHGKIHFDCSDIRYTNFSNYTNIDKDIKNGKLHVTMSAISIMQFSITIPLKSLLN